MAAPTFTKSGFVAALKRVVAGARKYNAAGRLFFPAALVFLLGAGYLASLLPGIGASGDTIKFQFVGKILGVPHATGYPLYTVLNYLFVTLFPFGGTAYKANLLSAVCAVGACVMLFKLLRLLGVGNVVALVSALAFGFSKAFWSFAVVAEVYTLLVLFMAAVSYFLVKWHLQRRDRDFYLATALYALSFGNHLLAITLLPAFAFLVFATDRRVFIEPRKVLWVLAVVSLGALQYGFLGWRMALPETLYTEGLRYGAGSLDWPTFFYFVTGAQFKPAMFAFTLEEFLTQRVRLFLLFMQRDLPVLSTVGLFGVFGSRIGRPVRTFLLIYFLTNALYAVNYNIPDLEGYFLMNSWVAAVFVGAALERHVQWRLERRQRWIFAVLCCVPLVYFGARYPAVNRSDTSIQRTQTEAMLRAVGGDAVLLARNYQVGQGFLYYLLAEGQGEAQNLHAVSFRGNEGRLRGYAAGDQTLKPLAQREVPPGLPLYAYPCRPGGSAEAHAAELGLSALWTLPETPYLCRLELAEQGGTVFSRTDPYALP